MSQLNQFLMMNDCLTTPAKETCYKTTRLLLIATTRELDMTNIQVEGLNKSIDQLIKNIDIIITQLSNEEKK